MTHALLVQEFLDMTPDAQAQCVAIAKRNHKRGICFLCSWIVKKIRFDDFSRASRMKHLVLCCDREGARA